MLDYINYIILGIAQGLFEWIPISSEGMVALLSDFLSMSANPVDMALFLHAGTLLAVIIYFRKDWVEVLRLRDEKMVKFLAITTTISLALGFVLHTYLRNVAVGSSLLFLTGLALLATSYFNRKEGKDSWLDFSKTTLVAGLLQGLAVIPGFSRSGSTMFGLSLGDLSPEEVLKYSYMMSVPVIVASTVYLSILEPVLWDAWPALIAAFITGLASLAFFMRFAERMDFAKFTLVLGVLCIFGALLAF